MDLSNMRICVTCPKCSEVSNLVEGNMSKLDVIVQPEQRLKLTLWTCPHCGKQKVVEIDTEETQELFSRIIEVVVTHPEGLPYEFAELSEKLSQIRTGLASRYDKALYQIEGDSGDPPQSHQLDYGVPDAYIDSGEKEN